VTAYQERPGTSVIAEDGEIGGPSRQGGDPDAHLAVLEDLFQSTQRPASLPTAHQLPYLRVQGGGPQLGHHQTDRHDSA
jgi:hypothetical protein